MANWPGLALGPAGLGLADMGGLGTNFDNGGGPLDTRQNLGDFGGATSLNNLGALGTTPDAESLNGINSYLGENYNTPSNAGLTSLNGLNGLDSSVSLPNLGATNSFGSLSSNPYGQNNYGISKLLGTDTGVTGGLDQTNSYTQGSNLLGSSLSNSFTNQQLNGISQGNFENAANVGSDLANGQQQPLTTNSKQFIGDCKYHALETLVLNLCFVTYMPSDPKPDTLS